MDRYYVCRDDGDEFVKIAAMPDYFDAVIEAVVYSKKHHCEVVVIHGNDIIYRVRP